MTVLLIGGNGFIGTALARTLLKRGQHVVSLDVSPQSRLSDDALTTAQADVTDFADLLTLFEAHSPDVVVNLAYMLGAESDANPQRAVAVNCAGMDNVMRAAGATGASRVVYASSISVYGDPENYDDPVTEETPPPASYSDYPSMFYNATKQFNEYQGRLYADTFDYSTIAIRPSMVFGPGRGGGLNSWIADFVRKPMRGDPAHVPYCSDRQLSLVYVDDVAQLFAEVAMRPEVAHHAYNTGGQKITAGALAHLVEDEIGGRVTCARTPDEELRPLMVTSETNDRAVDEFDYRVRPLSEAVRTYADSLADESGT